MRRKRARRKIVSADVAVFPLHTNTLKKWSTQRWSLAQFTVKHKHIDTPTHRHAQTHTDTILLSSLALVLLFPVPLPSLSPFLRFYPVKACLDDGLLLCIVEPVLIVSVGVPGNVRDKLLCCKRHESHPVDFGKT